MRLAEDVLLTREGWEGLREELARTQADHRARLADYLALRRADRSDAESVDYQPSDIVILARRIAEIEAVLSRAVVVGEAEREPGRVGVGSWVAVRWEDGDESSYVVVSPLEVDPRAGRISYESPVGQALLGRVTGEIVEVAAPSGTSRLMILAIR